MNLLKQLLPRAGMIYPPQPRVFGRSYRDTKILIALKQAGIIDIHAGLKRNELKKAVDEAIAEVFNLALSPPIFAMLTGQCQGSRDHLVALRDATPWARRDWTVTWFKFFLGMVYARINWQVNRRPPFNTEQHTATAKSIDAFLEAAKDLWSPVHFSFKRGEPGRNQPRRNEQRERGRAASNITPTSSETPRDMEFDMGSLMATLISDTAADDIISGIERLVIEDDEDDDGIL
ncbi:hypothetical protein F4821DRAFT_276604 [Hypoxylon rubiginosum]|uniref:Uncharacterized protein n=1 Tax=Hypoxylon rubiginosum TaxID=110542 RepID=A0ACC0CIL6_9PEZI|nr:hypothetical protein F4821DRAFT_276604 [Hypoxylon rubiginosum]